MSKASVKRGSRINLEASSFDAASASQVRLKDAYPWRVEEQQGNLTHEKEQISEETDDSEYDPWYYKPVAQTNKACGKPLAGETAESISSAFQKSQNNKEATMEHFFAMSPQTISDTEAVYDMLRKIYGRPSDDPMEDLDVNAAIWGVFMNATLKAGSHFRNDHDVNLRHVKNSFWRSAGQPFFGETEKLISGLTETIGISLIDSEDLMWISTSLLHSRAYQCANAKVHVFRLGAVFGENGETILLSPGRNKFSGTRKPTTSANWIEYGTYNSKPNECWDRTAEKIMQNFQRSGHSIFRCTSALAERTIKKQRRRKDNSTFHSKWRQCLVAPKKMVISVNQLRSSRGFD